MSTKTWIFIMVTLGSIIGGFVPSLWGDSMFSYASVITSTVGGVIGVFAGIKFSDMSSD